MLFHCRLKIAYSGSDIGRRCCLCDLLTGVDDWLTCLARPWLIVSHPDTSCVDEEIQTSTQQHHEIKRANTYLLSLAAIFIVDRPTSSSEYGGKFMSTIASISRPHQPHPQLLECGEPRPIDRFQRKQRLPSPSTWRCARSRPQRSL